MNSFNIPSTHNFQSIKFDFDNPKDCISKSLSSYLYKVKQLIDSNFEEWDNVKKYTNPYEFIHTCIPNLKCSISSIKPLSRSFYKMIELCNTFNFHKLKGPIKSFHLAEGPGGFIEALTYLRKKMPDFHKDNYYGMTLIDNTDDNIPGWNKTSSFLENNPQVKLEMGETNDGDLLNLKNLQFVKFHYGNSMDLITADGGFDFSVDFNKQEYMATNLIFAEICFAINMQKVGGSFILKVFDIFSKCSVDMIYLLSIYYKDVNIVKPKTSRYANSERYIICNEFEIPQFHNKFQNDIEKIYPELRTKTLTNIFKENPPIIFLNKLEEANAILGQQQIENIMSTFDLVYSINKQTRIESLKKNYINKCIFWCEKNNIPFTINKIATNIFMQRKDSDQNETTIGGVEDISILQEDVNDEKVSAEIK